MDQLVQLGRARAPGPKKKLYIRTFGCQMNEYDSQKLERLLADEYEPTTEPATADVVLINTCSVREKPEQKLYSLLGEIAELKSAKPSMLVGVGGCVAQQEGERIVSRSRVVDVVFGTHNLSLVPSLLKQRAAGAPPQVAVDYRDGWEELPLGLSNDSRVSVFVAISRGCNKNCTYCIVPTTRGKEVSRSPEEIEREVRIAVHRGAREVVLLGQTVNSYGLDFTPRSSFAALVERLAGIEQLQRIRFTSPHPQEVRQDFIDLVSKTPKVCRHIHMPLQSGSDRILKAMNRNYRRKRYLAIIDALRAAVPDLAITTDIIVGFPGETVEDFEQTLELLELVRFDSSFSFMFSPRPGTPAAAMPDDVPHEEKLRRLQVFQARQEEITAERLAETVGQRVEVLLDGPSHHDPSRLRGRTSQNVVLNLQDHRDDLAPGVTVWCEVTGTARHTLRGVLCESSSPSAARSGSIVGQAEA